MTHYAPRERAALADTLLRVGPDAPTLDDPWRTRDLAAHLVIRDTRPDLVAGMFVPALAGRLDSAMRETAAGDWEGLVRRVRSGSPWWSPTRVPALNEAMNLGEMFIHHEDVLRGGEGWSARSLDEGLTAALWKQLGTASRLFLRSAPTGVVLVAEGHGRLAAKAPTGPGVAVVTGSPGELTLFVSGRQRVADVQVEGSDEVVEAIRGASLGG